MDRPNPTRRLTALQRNQLQVDGHASHPLNAKVGSRSESSGSLHQYPKKSLTLQEPIYPLGTPFRNGKKDPYIPSIFTTRHQYTRIQRCRKFGWCRDLEEQDREQRAWQLKPQQDEILEDLYRPEMEADAERIFRAEEERALRLRLAER